MNNRTLLLPLLLPLLLALLSIHRVFAVELVIPEGTTSISGNAYTNRTDITSVVIPVGVTSIGNYAFSGCTSLTSISLPDSVTTIGEGAFRDCIKLTAIALPARLTQIANRLFDNCRNLESITLPNELRSIGNYAFRECCLLASISIPGSVLSIGEGAFRGCNELTAIALPAGLTQIANRLFENCWNLESVTLPNVLRSIGDYAFSECSLLASISIPGSVLSIGRCAFSGCTSLSSIELPSRLGTIENYTFSFCSNLTAIEIPKSVTNIGSYAFEDCHCLSSIVISEGVRSIGSYAFTNCFSLTSIVFPNSVTIIGNCPFLGCGKLDSVTLPSGMTSIGEALFYECGLKTFAIPEGITSIGEKVFKESGALKTVIFPSTLTSIGYKVFSGCNSLAALLAYGPPPTVEYNNFYAPEGTVLHVIENMGWEEAVDKDGRFCGVQVIIHPRPFADMVFSDAWNGDEAVLDIVADGAWTIVGVPDWLELGATAGEGAMQLPIVYAPNGAVLPREVTLTLTLECGLSFEITVKQAGMPLDLTVNGETRQVLYGSELTVLAPEKEGHTFASWTAEGIALENPDTPELSFAMPANAVKLTATYTVNRYTLTVDGIATEREYGSAVTVTAEERKRYEFTEWTAEGVTLAKPQEKTLTFVMPANDVTLTPAYKTEYIEFVLSLEEGWNLVTLPFTPDAESFGMLAPFAPMTLDTVKLVYQRIGAAHAIAPGRAFWVFSRNAAKLSLYSKEAPNWSLTISKGWNLVGALKDVAAEKLPANVISVWSWSPTTRCYSPVTTGLKMGTAYYLLAE